MNVLVVGCGRIGAGLTRTLVQRGHHVVVIDKNSEAFLRLGAVKVRTVEGIGFDRDVLLDAGIERADALAAVTSSDEANVVTAQIARQVFHVPKVVARLFDPHQAEIYRRLGLQTVAPNAWGIQRTADLLCHSWLETVAELGNGEIQLVSAEVSPLMAHRSVHEVFAPGETTVVAIERNNNSFLPAPHTRLEQGDIVYLAAASGALDRLNHLFEVR